MTILRSVHGAGPAKVSTRRLCEASYQSAWTRARGFELRLNVAATAGMLLLTCGSARAALDHVSGNSDMAVQIRAYLRRVIEEEAGDAFRR